jgi:transcriptional regulator with XRE-family HTH domain
VRTLQQVFSAVSIALSPIERSLLDLKQLGGALRDLREDLGLTQEQFAKKADLSFSTYGKLERGEASATFELLNRVFDAHGVSIAEGFARIFGYEPEERDLTIQQCISKIDRHSQEVQRYTEELREKIRQITG